MVLNQPTGFLDPLGGLKVMGSAAGRRAVKEGEKKDGEEKKECCDISE